MKTLKKLGFDIGYLALLTKEDVKPLSRWESKFSRGQLKALHHLGLKTNTVERKLLNGKSITELIFSKSSRYLDIYSRKFHNTPLRKDRRSVIAEGFLFGYPGCCVRNFAENGYTDNTLVGHDQEILFHWACPDCRVTPSLLPYYRKTRRECQELLGAKAPTVPALLKKSLPAAALSLMFTLAPGKARADDPHWYCSTAVDTNGNFLTSGEDFLLGTYWEYNSGELLSGPAEALRFKDIIESLPTDTSDYHCYLENWLMMGEETCRVCGEWINMGFVIIRNPMRGISIEIPYMGLHYMAHGSFSYDGTVNSGRVDIQLLKQVLAHYDTAHYSMETPNDSDSDGLRDDAEDHFGTLINDPDSNENQLVDGAEVAEGHAEIISRLPLIGFGQTPPTNSPYMTFIPADGIETCDICGFSISMGLASVVNPLNDTRISFPNMALHYLAHGRFAYSSSLTSSEIDPVLLDTVLNTITSAPPPGHLPKEHRLSLSNYPNPFNAGTQIQFTLPEAGHANLRIYNINGQHVRALLNDNIEAGRHQTSWDGRDDRGVRVASGVYFCRLEHGGSIQARKMLLVK